MKECISNFFFHAYKWQPRSRLLNIQEKQFSNKKAKMQWWYYDFFSDNGLIGVLAFIPQKWWQNTKLASITDSYVMLSLREADGRIVRYMQEVNSAQFVFKDTGLQIGDCITLNYKVENGKSHLQFNFEGVKGWLDLSSNTDPFSALPLGTLSGLARKIGKQSEWSRSQFRYVSQIPNGGVQGQLKTIEKETHFIGYGYHEQGWFNDEPHLLNQGWSWFHFLHPECNIFGLPEGYIYVRMKDQIVLGGMCLFIENYKMEIKKFENSTSPKILTGGQIRFESKGIKIEIHLDSDTNQELIEFNAIKTAQLWNTSVVQSTCSIKIKDQSYNFSGHAMLETCWLQK